MPYTHLTLGNAKIELAARLHDPAYTFWTNAGAYNELNLYIWEALRTWGALSAYWRERGTFNTVANTTFYDLPIQLAALRGYTVYDSDMVALIQYHLLEPATPALWSGTEQFTLADLTFALQRRRNQFLAETGCVITRTTPAMPAPPIARAPLPDNVIDVRRVVWRDAGVTHYQLWRSDEWEWAAFDTAWSVTAGVPVSYSVSAPPPLTIQVSPPPLNVADLEVLAVQTAANLNPALGILMNIPNDFTWIVKWGAMADLLSKDGPAADPQRADYCKQRYEQGIQLAKLSPCVVQAEITGVPLIMSSIGEMDAFNPNWQNTTGTPVNILDSGLNLIALQPVPSLITSVTVDVVRNAPIPTADGTNLQIGREELNVILNYAEHLAMFKIGGDEWLATQGAWEDMVKVAATYNRRLSAASRYMDAMAEQSKREARVRPREVERA